MRSILLCLIVLLIAYKASLAQVESDTSAFPIDTTGWHVYDDTTKARMLLDSAKDKRGKAKYDIALQLAKASSELYENMLGEKDTLTANAYQSIGLALSAKGEFNMALEYHNKSLNVCRSVLGDSHIHTANSYHNIGRVLLSKGEFETALLNFNKALNSYNELDSLVSINSANTINSIGNTYYSMNMFQEALNQYSKAINVYEQVSNSSTEYIMWPINNIGAVYYRLGNYRMAEKYSKDALKINLIKYGPKHPNVATSYNNLAVINKRRGDLELAIEYYKKSIKIREKTLDLNHPDLSSSYNNIGRAFLELNRPNEALNYFNKALRMYIAKFGGSHSNVANTLNSIGNTYHNMDSIHLTRQYYLRAIAIEKRNKSKNEINLANYFHNLGGTYLNNSDSALYFFEKAFIIRQQVFGENHEFVASSYDDIGSIWEKKNPEIAKQYYQKDLTILNNIFPKGHPQIAEAHYNIANVERMIGNVSTAKREYFEAFNHLGFPLFNRRADFTLNTDLTLIQECLNSITDLYLDSYRKSTDSQMLDTVIRLNDNFLNYCTHHSRYCTNKLDLIKLYNDSRRSIENRLKITQIHSNNSAKVNSFIKMQLFKAPIARSKILNSIDFYLKNTNINVVLSEEDLNYIFAYYEKKIYQEKYESKTPNDSLITVYENQLFDLKRERDQLMETLKKEYPDYWNLKYNFEVASLDEVQEHLTENQSLLEYFVGDSSIFIFVVRSDTFHIEEVKHDFPLDDWVNSLQTLILKQGQTLTATPMDSFRQTSYHLYKKLIQPVDDLLSEDLIIVPDGILGYIPFDVLVSNDSSESGGGRYLIQDHQIAYQYSATLWLEMMKKEVNPSKQVLAIAPDFPPRPVNWAEIDSINQLIASRGDLYKLAYTNDEINSISNYWSTQFMTGNLATVQNFIQDASDYRIVHLASHGKADDRVGDYCYLAFTETSDTLDRKLYVRDLYNMELNAEMVVLSACETGMGELQQGEGILSLARGFVYAGAKSIISTLWSVNDQSTKDIMSAFYKNLKEGQSKDEALRNAKLNFIEENPGAHPYYWAAFTAVGDMSPISSGWPLWVWGLLIIFILSLTLIIKRIF